MTDSTLASRKKRLQQDRDDYANRLAEAEALVNSSELAQEYKEADAIGYFGETPEEVDNRAFTVAGVIRDPYEAAVSGRPQVAKVIGRDLAGHPAGEPQPEAKQAVENVPSDPDSDDAKSAKKK